MKILYDHQIFTQQNYGGISRYFCELMDQFESIPDISYTLALRYSHNENLRNRPSITPHWSARSNLLSSRVFPHIRQVIHVDILNQLRINRRESLHLLKKQDFDVFHPTYYDPYFLPYLEKKPSVLTVYDMIHERFPEHFSSRDPTAVWKKRLIEKAESVVAISENTRNDIIQCTDVDPDRITVIYLGNPLEFFKDSPEEVMDTGIPDFEKPYLLFVGNRSGYKNFNFFITAVAKLLKKDEKLQVYCAGGGAFTTGEIQLLMDLAIYPKVHVVSINDAIMKQLYKNALAFIFPSRYEGFGLPILEAFSCGCPTVVSNTSSFPEIAGDAACYIDPEDAGSIVFGIESVISVQQYREELVRKGYERLTFFSWVKTARDTKRVYDNLLHQ